MEIKKNDVVSLFLSNGSILHDCIVKTIPKKNEIYWEFEAPDGGIYLTGTSMAAVWKKA